MIYIKLPDIYSRDFKGLLLYQKSFELVDQIFRLLDLSGIQGSNRDYILKTAQLIPLLIAKGNSQLFYNAEYANLSEAISKARILIEQIDKLNKNGDISSKQAKKLFFKIEEVIKMLYKYRSNLGRKVYGKE